MAYSISDEQILEAAVDVMAREGYAGATTREIAVAAGINEVTLFRRFGSKDRLLQAAVEREAEYFIASGIEYTGDLEADLLRIVGFYHHLMQERGHVIVMLLSEAPRQPELLDIMETPLSIASKIGGIIERYQKEGALVEERPLQSLMALVGPLFMRGVIGYMDPTVFDREMDLPELVRRFLQGHGRRW